MYNLQVYIHTSVVYSVFMFDVHVRINIKTREKMMELDAGRKCANRLVYSEHHCTNP